MATSGLSGQNNAEPATEYVAVTPADGSDLTKGVTGTWPRALYIGVSGDVSLDPVDGSATAVVFKSVPIGILPCRCKRVRSTATTATNIVALY